jgi:hypothetical protein
VASAGPRYFGFVIGGALPVAVAADWLTSAWDQNGGGYVASPALSVAEEVVAGWIRDLLGLPSACGVAFVTGCQMAHFTCLAAARHAVLRDAGWDVEAHGLQGGPALRVIASEQAHVTVTVACRMLGLGAERVRLVPTDDPQSLRPRWPNRRARRSSAHRRARSTPAHSTRSPTSSSCAGRATRGVTSTARLDSGRRSARPAEACSKGLSERTRGRPTDTSG